MIDRGTKYTLSADCRLARGNPQWPGVLGSFSESKMSWYTFLVDLKAHSTTCEKNQPIRVFNTFNLKKTVRFETIS